MQTPDNHQQPSDEALEAPPKLVSALRQLPRERFFVPPTLDEAMLRAARRTLCKPERAEFKWFHLVPLAAAVAVAICLLAPAYQAVRRSASKPNREPVWAKGDINHDGRVDILDAFALARQLQSGAKPGPETDVNGDGVVDERDVAAIAARAVKLGQGGHS
jgi:hypothetical protein